MQTTLYNHRLAGDGIKSLLPNAEMKAACERIERGEKGVKDSLTEYSLAPTQESIIDWLTEMYNK